MPRVAPEGVPDDAPLDDSAGKVRTGSGESQEIFSWLLVHGASPQQSSSGLAILGAVEIDVTELLKANPALVLFLVLGFGLMLGRIRIGGVEIGAVTGVLLVGLVAGHRGLDIPTSSQSLGFVLFIYCVGLQAGPEVVRVFKQDGARYLVLSVVAAVSGLAIAGAADRFFDF